MITDEEIRDSLLEPINQIVEAVRLSLRTDAPELASDIDRPRYRVGRRRRVAESLEYPTARRNRFAGYDGGRSSHGRGHGRGKGLG